MLNSKAALLGRAGRPMESSDEGAPEGEAPSGIAA